MVIDMVDEEDIVVSSGPRSALWSSTGDWYSEEDGLDATLTRHGMNWSLLESEAKYCYPSNDEESDERDFVQTVTDKKFRFLDFTDRKILFRSDTKEALSMVSESFKVVQPIEVLNFFKECAANNGMEIDVIGSLFNGRRFYTLLGSGRNEDIVPGDSVSGQVLLTTAVDGSMSTQAYFIVTRDYSNSVLPLSIGNSNRPLVRITHKKEWDPSDFKLDQKSIDESWALCISNMKRLASQKMDARRTREFFERELFVPTRDANAQSWAVTKEVLQLTDLSLKGSGSVFSSGTAYGALNGAAEYWTFGNGKRNPSAQFWDAYVGGSKSRKQDIYNLLCGLF